MRLGSSESSQPLDVAGELTHRLSLSRTTFGRRIGFCFGFCFGFALWLGTLGRFLIRSGIFFISGGTIICLVESRSFEDNSCPRSNHPLGFGLSAGRALLGRFRCNCLKLFPGMLATGAFIIVCGHGRDGVGVGVKESKLPVSRSLVRLKTWGRD